MRAIAIQDYTIALHHDAIGHTGRESSDKIATHVIDRRCPKVPLANTGVPAMPDRIQDSVILGGLALVFIWTYVVLPLAFYQA
jgi:hypothetical protein